MAPRDVTLVDVIWIDKLWTKEISCAGEIQRYFPSATVRVKESAAGCWWCEVPKLGPRNSVAVFDSGNYSRGSPEQ